MKKHLLLLVHVFAAAFTAGAQIIYTGPDTVACPGSITLSATTNNNSSANGYTVTSIPYGPYSFTSGTNVFLGDDAVSNVLNIGFTFSFMGNSYMQFYIGSNGWVAFSLQPSSFTLLPLPSNDPNIPKNCVMGAFQDLNPGAGGSIYYTTTGTAPNRKLIVSWYNVPLYSCNTPVTQQIVLYESSNIIENYYMNKPVCTSWSNGYAIAGIQNSTGTTAYTIAGRNCTAWTANNEGWRYTPASALDLGPVNWYNAAGTLIGTGNNISTGFSTSTYYIATVYDSTSMMMYDDTVYVNTGIPGLNVTTVNPSCASTMNGSATVTAPGGPYTYSWSTGATAASISGLAAGSYTVTVSNSSGCSETVVVNISSASQLTTMATHHSVSCASCNDGIVYGTPVGGSPPYTYVWQPGNITTQDIYNVSPGTYTVCITDANGCTMCDSTTIEPYGTGIEEHSTIISFQLDPNPSQQDIVTLTLNSLQEQDAALSITDVTGKEVQRGSLTMTRGTSKHVLHTGTLPKGIYFVQVKGDHSLAVRKLIVY